MWAMTSFPNCPAITDQSLRFICKRNWKPIYMPGIPRSGARQDLATAGHRDQGGWRLGFLCSVPSVRCGGSIRILVCRAYKCSVSLFYLFFVAAATKRRLPNRGLHSARRMLRGFFTITSQLDSTPTAVTSSNVTATPMRLTEGASCQGIFMPYLLIAHVSPMAPDEPMAPATSPNTPYSIRVM